ncbi:MAG: B12-binding domain-containing radical SAM protein [Pseudomonadota bacterium]
MKQFLVVLIKPSHYDDDGYVIQWFRSPIPSNSLASVYGLIAECADNKVLGDDVEILYEAMDETNTVIPCKKIIERIRAADGGLVGLVGVQTNQFPRALDLARQFRKADIPVVIGGFHGAGCISMLSETPPELREAAAIGASIYAGEAEGRMDVVLRDVWQGTLKPLYNYMRDLPGLEETTLPFLPAHVIRKMAGAPTSFDAGRGCPFQCSFCTIINVQGRKSRHRSPDDVERIIKINAAHGIKRFFVTDDNFARNRNWEAILDRMIHLRENEGMKFKMVLQVDTLCYRLPGFVEKAARAGCSRVFIGLENIDPDALTAAKKRQNKIWEYRQMLQAWKEAGVITYAGYILGFPDDTPEKIRRNIEIIKNELPLDMIEFFFLTPLPGSEDHKVLQAKGVWMDPDLNKYDLNHRVANHSTMSDAEWEKLYYDCWRQYYTPEHVETILRREAARGGRTKALHASMVHFLGSILIEKVHPLETGILRRKVRRQRRPGLPIENPLIFYPRRAREVIVTAARWIHLHQKFKAIHERVKKDESAKSHSDLALTPVSAEEQLDLDIIKTFKDAIPNTHGAPVVPAKRAEPEAAPTRAAG